MVAWSVHPRNTARFSHAGILPTVRLLDGDAEIVQEVDDDLRADPSAVIVTERVGQDVQPA